MKLIIISTLEGSLVMACFAHLQDKSWGNNKSDEKHLQQIENQFCPSK